MQYKKNITVITFLTIQFSKSAKKIIKPGFDTDYRMKIH